MRKALIAVAAIAAGILFLSLPVFAESIADNIKVGDTIGIYYGPYPTLEGPFRIKLSEPNTSVEFLTFCVESQEYFYPTNWNSNYKYKASDISYSVITDPNSSSKILSREAAYLFYHYRLNDLGVDITNPLVLDKLQYAIWFWEAELGGANNEFGDSFFKDSYGNLKVPEEKLNEAYQHVRVLNPQYMEGDPLPPGTEAQSFLMLVETPEPETLILLGCGLVGLGLVSRRKPLGGRR